MADLKQQYFWIEFEETGGTITGLTNDYTDMYHSFDGSTWKITLNTLSMRDNTLVYFKNDSKKISDTEQQLNINFKSNAKVGGNLSSITDMTEWCCYGLFKSNYYLTDASELILPWDTLAPYCFNTMFQGCVRLTTAPELPTTTLAPYCYGAMFNDCTNLTTAPELPAITLVPHCYEFMFSSCQNLTIAPELPATTLAEYCYSNMFSYCINLTTAPELPAITLVPHCYEFMFENCNKLTKAPALPATTLAEYCYRNMFSYCINLTTAPELPAITLAPHCYEFMFENCENLTTAPELPATTLAPYCYESMFRSCDNFTTAPPELPATTLAEYCYSHMFCGCENLTTAPELPATTLAPYCYENMFLFCYNFVNAPELPATTLAEHCYCGMFSYTSLKTAPELPATTLAEYCYSDMFGNTSLKTAPELPADTLFEGCYRYMFYGCTKLETAPLLPATTLDIVSYSNMFMGCTSLNYIKMLATDISADYCLNRWVENVAPTGTFVKSASNTDIPIDSVNGIPVGWTVRNEGNPETEEELKQQYFWVEFEETGGVVSISNSTFSYSFNGIDWTNSASSVSLGTNVIVYLKDNATPGYSVHIGFNKNAKVGGNISSLNEIGENAFANLFMDKTYLTDASELILPWDTLAPYCFNAMFYGCTSLKKAPVLPATTLADSCYMAMFQGCTSLTTAPELPATTLAVRCYDAMFRGCSSLLYSPELPATSVEQESCEMMFLECSSLKTIPSILPATTLKKKCYYRMFEGCSSITTAPTLPATTLAEYCYYSMFNGCTLLKNVPSTLPSTTLAKGCYKNMFRYCESLEIAPELPANSLTTECYHYMFAGCTSLRYIKMLSSLSYFSSSYTTEWVYGVASSGTFVKHPDSGFKVSGTDGIPVGWTVYNEGDPDIPEPDYPGGEEDPDEPETPAIDYFWIELENDGTIIGLNSDLIYSYNGVDAFVCTNTLSLSGGCKVYIRVENTTNLDKDVLFSFFSTTKHKIGGKLSSLGNINQGVFQMLFKNDEGLTDASELIFDWETLTEYAFSHMFQGCTSLMYAPELPATNLAAYCYVGMFDGCTSLVDAPELPADTLFEGCYMSMFAGCSSLKCAPALNAETLAAYCYSAMFNNCTSLEVAPILRAELLQDGCYNRMFQGCTSLTYIKMMGDLGSLNNCPYSGLWVEDVSSNGVFVKNSNYDLFRGEYGIPVGWTVYNEGSASEPPTPECGGDDPDEPTDPDNPNPPVDPDIPDSGDTTVIPEIRLYKTQLNYTDEGGSNYIQVDYYGATSINTPTCQQSWVTITKTQEGFTYEDDVVVVQHMYKITIDATTYSRSTNVTFSCTDANGTTYTDSHLLLNQVGPASDNGSFAILSKNEITLKEIGDEDTIEVIFTNIEDILAPEVPYGYEITEVSRETLDDNTIKVIYKITKIEEVKEDVKVIFKAQGVGGTSVKSEDVTINGWVPPTEPATITIPEFNFNNDGYLEFDYTGGTKTISMSIDGYTKPITVTYTINDTNNNITITRSELDYDDGYDYGVWDFDIVSAGNNGSEAITGTIEIHYVDGLTDKTLTIPFYVRYENEGMISPFSNNFKYDKDGGLLSLYDTVNVGYLNIATINTPTASEWITVSEGELQTGTFIGVDSVYQYAISVAANEGVERTGSVIFTGIGNDGKTYTASITVFQEGSDTEVIIDEGYIELQSLSVALPAEGGSDTFMVKYYDAAEIQMPELEDTWATIEEIDSTEEDGTAWNGTECVVTTKTYRVTAQSTTYGRVMKVVCKMTSNENIYFEKDKFRINQLAPDSDGTQGYVYAFNSKITISANGFANGNTVWVEARVGYKDVTIETPIISADWITVSDVVDKGSSKEYDYIKYYEFNFAENESNVSRQATVTFVGTSENNTQSRAVVTIIQSGAEGPNIDDGGRYKNYKGYFKSLKGVLYSVSFITDPSSSIFGDMVLAGDSPVIVSYSEAGRLYEPLRTSTCTISVVSSTYFMELYTGKAQGTQVILKNETNDSVEWCGFLQPNLYNQGFSEPIETIEFEASDCISTLQYFDYEDHFVNGRFMVTFKDIIDDIMDRSKLIKSYFLTNKTFSDSYQSKTMKFSDFNISENNFYSEEEEPWKLQEVLEEICKYMGLVCFQWGDSVYFIDYDMYSTNKTMIGYKWDKSNYWNTIESVVICDGANEIDVNSYMATGADMSLDDVFNKVTVNCNYYNIESLIPDMFEDDFLTNRFGDNAVITISRYGGRGNSVLLNKTFYRVYDHKYINSLYYSPITSYTSTHQTKVVPTEEQFNDRFFFRDFIGGNIVDMVHLNYSEANQEVGESKDFERYLLISQLNRPWCGAEGTFHWENYNFPIMEYKNMPVIFIDNTAEDEITRTVARRSISAGGTTSGYPNNRPKKNVPVPNYLVINASAAFVADMKGEYLSDTIEPGLGKKWTQSWYTYGGSSIDQVRNTPALCFYLEIPQAGWWDGSEWVDYKTHFEVPLEYFGEGKDDDKFYEKLWATEKSVKNNVETYLFLGTTGYRIPLPKEMDTTRDMYFAIAMPKRFVHCSDSYGGDNTGEVGNAYCFIKDLELNIVNRNTVFFDNEDEIYENIIDEGNVIEGEEIDLKITSDNYRTFSLSTVSTRTAEDVATTEIKFYDKNYKLLLPEEAIISRYVNQYSTPSIKTNLTLDLSFKPNQIITDTYWSKDFVIIGQEIDYQYDRQTITLLEKK